MLVFQIQDDKKPIIEKNLQRNSKMMILGIDDHGMSTIFYFLWPKMHVEINSSILGFVEKSHYEVRQNLQK